jgi:chemotaxis protein CheD
MKRDITSIFLHPGDYHFDRVGAHIRTLLGSCVAITLWHPRHRIGGMCHFLLPGRTRASSTPFDGRYADEALLLLAEEMCAVGTAPEEYEARLYGGGNMFPAMTNSGEALIGRKNALAAKQLLNHYGIRIMAQSLEGTGYRSVEFDVASGQVKVKHKRLAVEPRQCSHCENKLLCHGGVLCERRIEAIAKFGA